MGKLINGFQHKGPIAQQFYFLLFIDEYSRFPEVEVFSTTTISKVIPNPGHILDTHGVPEVIKSDRRPPRNGTEFKEYVRKGGFHHQVVTSKQPSSTGLAENFMYMLQKVAHTAYIEHKDPREAVHQYLLAYRATPHTATGCSPAELLFNSYLKTTIPTMRQPKFHPEVVQRGLTYKQTTKE